MVTVEDEDEVRARGEAEARRAKILQMSNDRMGLVTGVLHPDEPDDAKAKGLSKMAAARRRRFKKKDDGGGAGAAKDGAEDAAEAATTGTAEDAAAEPSVPAQASAPEPEEPSPPLELALEASEAGGQEEPKTKYRGVARIRRQMLKEKHQKKAPDGEPEDDVAAASSAKNELAHAAGATTAAATVPVRRPRNFYSAFPILMHVVAVVLLFGAGLDVGLQQRPAPTVRVHTSLAPQEEFRILRLFQKRSQDSLGNLPSAEELLRQAEELQDLVIAEPDVEEDEFRIPSGGDDDPGAASSIDPLFGVDLDLYTQGDSLYMTLARGAVKLHRVNLAVFYYLPLRAVNYAWQTLEQLSRSPPLLCLVAVVIRQVVAKGILGAHLPKPPPEEPQKEVLGMIKQFVQGFVVKSFPTAVSLYDAWSHLRADMYVVLCGLVVGLAIRHAPSQVLDDPTAGGVVLDAATRSSSPMVEGSDEL